MRQALSSAAFSRSSRPMRPSRCERVTATSGHSSRRIAAASSSHEAFSGEKTAATATERMPGVADPPRGRAHARARRTARAGGRRTRGRPRASPPRPRTSAARSSGQSTKGGSDAPEGRPMRTAATRPRSRRWTTALVKWVVPIITAWASRARRVPAPPARRGRGVIPAVTSAVVGVLTAAATASSSSRTASVLVPPTSMPMRRLTRTPTEVEVVAEGARADVLEAPSGVSRIGGAGRAMTVTRWP